MIGGQKVAAVIVGRGGSKGLPGKNLADLGGKPLIAWSVAAAMVSAYVDMVAVSSDDDGILDAARKSGCEHAIRRPDDLATDVASVHDALVHALNALNWSDGYVVLLQATSPLRTAGDIDACIEACVEADAPSAVTVAAVSKPPQWMFRINDVQTLSPLIENDGLYRRQDTEQVYALNGAVYVAHTEWYRRNRNFICEETVATIMPAERSVDVDTEMDLTLARALLV